MSVWNDAEPLVCTSRVPEAPDVCTFSFSAATASEFRYSAGQFVSLELPVPGGPVVRTYTLSSSPSRPRLISVTVKAQADSVGTRWMLDHLRPGDTLRAIGPAGTFTLPDTGDGKYLFISAGSGVTPALSMSTWLYDTTSSPDICFVQCAQGPSQIIARRQMEGLASRVPGIRLHYVVEDDEPFTVWTGYRGYLSQIMLGSMAPDFLEREVFCCGPEPFMQAVRDMLNGLGFDMERYYQESFGSPAEALSDDQEWDDLVPDEAVSSRVVFANSSVTVECRESDSLLAVAKGAGLNIPSGCTIGLCGTCKVRKVAGTVHMVHNGGISEEEIEEGYVLACCSNPIGTVEIDV